MAITAQTTQQISDNLIAQLEASLNQSIPGLPKGFYRVLAKAFSGVFVLLWKYGGFILLQQYAKYASSKEVSVNGRQIIPLVELGRMVGVSDPGLGVNAEYTLNISVTNQTGSLQAGSQLIRPQTGVIFITKAAVLLNAPIIQVDVVAASDQSGGNGTGTIGNIDPLDPDQTLSFVNPLANVSGTADIDSQLVTGVDAESVDVEYRQRVVDFFQKRPQGGSYSDYELWGEETSGVINVYPYTGLPGQVDVYSEVSSDIDPDGIPTAPILAAVKESIEKNENGIATRRNVNAYVNSYAITRTGFDVDIQDLVVSDLPNVLVTLTSAVDEYLRSREPFIDGLTTLPKKNKITQTGANSVVEDIVDAAGGTFTAVTVVLNGDITPIVTYILGHGEKAKLINLTLS